MPDGRRGHVAVPHPDRAVQFMPFAALRGFAELLRQREQEALQRWEGSAYREAADPGEVGFGEEGLGERCPDAERLCEERPDARDPRGADPDQEPPG